MRVSEEVMIQGEAFTKVQGFATAPLETIWKYGALFRTIILEHSVKGVTCTADDVVWIASQKLGKDIQTSRCMGGNTHASH